MRMQRALRVLALLFVIGAVRPADAATIKYEATQIDPATGVWEYQYEVSGFAFGPDTGFSIYFDYQTTGAIDAPTPPNADWDVMTFQPDPVLMSDGIYDALAVAAPGPASLADRFVIRFVHTGLTPPGSQFFEIYDLSNGFTVLDDGFTQPFIVGVAEPATLSLLGAGFAIVAAVRRRRAAMRA